MADLVKIIKLRDTIDRASYLLCNASDGTGETAIQKIDISAIQMAATKVKIKKLKWSIEGMQVSLLFDHTTDDTAIIMSGNGSLDEDCEAPLTDPGSSGGTGDILVTTQQTAAAKSGYCIYLEIEKLA